MSATELISASGRRGRRANVWLLREIRDHPAVNGILFGFILLVLAIAALRGDSLLLYLAEYADRILRALTLVVSAFVLVACTKALLHGHKSSPIAVAIDSLKRALSSTIAVRYIYACVILAFFMGAFLYCKMLIPAINPFSWDAAFAEWDRSLFGTDPWRLIHPVVGTPWVTFLLDVAYSSWVPAVFLFWAGLFASPRVPRQLQVQYWLASVLSWILVGLVMATVFSSAGPVYFTRFVTDVPSPYAGLLVYLDQVEAVHDMSSSTTKAFLWDVYTGVVALPGGISAMPSMHNTQSALFVAVAYRLDRRFGHAMLVYAALIFIGSIHLAWHYAVDGAVGAVAALAIWKASGALMRARWAVPA